MEIGEPLCQCTTAPVSHPPKSSSIMPPRFSHRRSRPNGRSTATLAFITCERWNSERPSSSCGRALSRNGSKRSRVLPSGLGPGLADRVIDLAQHAGLQLPPQLELQGVVIAEPPVLDQIRDVDAGIGEEHPA